MTSDLAELFCRLRRREIGASDDFAEAVRPELLQMARSYLRDAALAEDVAQESVLEALATHHSLRDVAALRAWLRLVVRKQADRATRRTRPVVPVETAGQLPDWVDGPDRIVSDSVMSRSSGVLSQSRATPTLFFSACVTSASGATRNSPNSWAPRPGPSENESTTPAGAFAPRSRRHPKPRSTTRR